MGGVCCGEAGPELNPDGTAKELPPLEQQLRDPEELRKAARGGDAAALEMFLRRMPKLAINSGATGEEVTAEQLGMTALHFAAANNWLTGCRLLVLYGASQKAKTAKSAGGRTPLQVAVQGGKRKVVAFLLELEEEPPPLPAKPGGKPPPVPRPWKSADVNITDAEGNTALLSVVLTGRQQFTAWFIDACAVYDKSLDYDAVNSDGDHVALCCARFGWWGLLKDKVLPSLKNAQKLVNKANRAGETILGWLLKTMLVGKMTIPAVEEWMDTLPGLDVSIPAFKERIPPISMAVALGSKKMVDKILSVGAPATEPGKPPKLVSAKDAMGRAPLHYAAAFGHKRLALHLVELGARVTDTDKARATPFHLAATRGYGEVTQALIDALSDQERTKALSAVDSSGRSMAHLCLMSKQSDDENQDGILKLLDQMDPAAYTTAVQDKIKDTPLMLAITHHLDKVVEVMIEKGADCNQPNFLQESPLARNLLSVTKATAARDAKIFNLIIQAGAIIDTPNPATHPLMAVCKNSVNEFSALAVRTLEDVASGKIKPTPPARPPPADGTAAAELESAPLMPPQPAPLDWDKVDEEGRGPLMLAAAHNNAYIIKYLANKDPSVIDKKADEKGMTALMYAASRASLDTIKLLLDLGADVKAVDSDGHSALWHALRMDVPETLDCAAMLLMKGASTKSADGKELLDGIGEGWLHRAVRMGAVDFVKLWAQCGGWLGIQCTTPETAMDLPGNDAVAAEQVDFLDEPLQELEAEIWEEEDPEGVTHGDTTLKVDPNKGVKSSVPDNGPGPDSVLRIGPVGEGVEWWPGRIPADRSPADRAAVQAMRALGPRWFDNLIHDDLPDLDQDDLVCEEMCDALAEMMRKERTAKLQDMGCVDPFDLEYHVQTLLRKLQLHEPGAIAESVEETARRSAQLQQDVIQQVDWDLRYQQQLLEGSDPLSVEALTQRRRLQQGSAVGAGPVAEAATKEGSGLIPAVHASGKSAPPLKSSTSRASSKSFFGSSSKRVTNSDPYYAPKEPGDEELYAYRKYSGEPQYIKSARERGKPWTAAELDAKADELHARLKSYADRDKVFDGANCLEGAALRSRNIRWWNLGLCPEEYPLKLGVWKKLDKKKQQAIAGAAARVAGAPLKPRNKSAFFGLPDMPTRPELLGTGAVTYAVRLCRPNCMTALLDLNDGLVNHMDSYGYPALSHALCMLGRDPANKTLSYIVDRLLLARPEANLTLRTKPITNPDHRKDIAKFVKRNMSDFGSCWVDSNVVDTSCCAGGAMAPDEKAVVSNLYKKLQLNGKEGRAHMQQWKKSARSCLPLCRADPLEPLIACVAMGDVSRLAWLVRRCGGLLESAWVHLPDIPTYYQGLLEKDVARCMSVCGPVHIAVAMRKFELTRVVLDLGGDPNACGTPHQSETHNPWAYAKSLNKIRDSLKSDWRDELDERAEAVKNRKKVDEEVLMPDDEARKNFKEGSQLEEDEQGTSILEVDVLNTKKLDEEFSKLKDRITGSIMARLKKLKRVVMSIEIPGMTRPHPWVTPLHLAARGGQAEIAFLLVERGASPDGGESRLFARRSPLQEAIMYARANFVEYNADALRPHHEAMTKGVEASIPSLNALLLAQQAKAAMGAVMAAANGNFSELAMKAFALAAKFLFSKLMEMRKRPIAHWDPALACAHVLLLARAPFDVGEAQTSIALRDLMDNSTWLWLGPDVHNKIQDPKWLHEAYVYAYRMKGSKTMGWKPMARSGDLKWYHFAKRFFTNRCDTAYFGAGVKALSAVYNKLSTEAVKKSETLSNQRQARLKNERQELIKQATQARQKRQAEQAPLLCSMREDAANRLSSPFMFDQTSFDLLDILEDTETMNKRLQEEAAKSAEEEMKLRSQLGDKEEADGGWARQELMGEVTDAFNTVKGAAVTGGFKNAARTAGDLVTSKVDDAAQDAAKDAVKDVLLGALEGGADNDMEERMSRLQEKRMRREMSQKLGKKKMTSFKEPKTHAFPPAKQHNKLSEHGTKKAKDNAEALDKLMQDRVAKSYVDTSSTANQALTDPVLTNMDPEDLSDATDMAAQGVDGAMDAASQMAARAEDMDDMSGGFDDDGDDADFDDGDLLDGAMGAAGDMTDGIGEIMAFCDDQ